MALPTIEPKKTALPLRQDVWPILRQEMDRMFTRFASNFDGLPFAAAGETLWPRIDRGLETGLDVAVDIAEDDEGYTVTAELPGIEAKDVDVRIAGDVLTIKGEKHTEAEDHKHYLSERSYGAFERSFTLPEDVLADRIDAKFAKGVLTMILPKNPKAVPEVQKIAVKAA